MVGQDTVTTPDLIVDERSHVFVSELSKKPIRFLPSATPLLRDAAFIC